MLTNRKDTKQYAKQHTQWYQTDVCMNCFEKKNNEKFSLPSAQL